jgi:hypothetical protein
MTLMWCHLRPGQVRSGASATAAVLRASPIDSGMLPTTHPTGVGVRPAGNAGEDGIAETGRMR